MNTETTVMKRINASTCNSMLENSTSLNDATNPFMQNLSNLSANELEMFLGQYCHFPRHIISLLVSACYTMGYYKWDDVVKEIRTNVHEELGQLYEKMEDIPLTLPPHYSMLRIAIEQGLGIDIQAIQLKKSTESFLEALKMPMEQLPSFTGGAVYSLEATAVKELKIVYEITKDLFKKKKREMPQLLHDFFTFHIGTIEVEHNHRLFELMNEYIINKEDEKNFYAGYKIVLEIMDKWWTSLYEEVKGNLNDG